MPTQPDLTQHTRKWKYEINTGTVAVPAWTLVRGVAESKPAPITPEMEDDDDYDHEGWKSSAKTSLRNNIELKMIRKRHPVTGVFDPGQEALRIRAGLLGVPGQAQVRWYDRTGGPEAYENWFEVDWQPDGGNTTDIEKITCNLLGKGKPDSIVNPAA